MTRKVAKFYVCLVPTINCLTHGKKYCTTQKYCRVRKRSLGINPLRRSVGPHVDWKCFHIGDGGDDDDDDGTFL